jgi:putative Mn2+ efflux pump MntP
MSAVSDSAEQQVAWEAGWRPRAAAAAALTAVGVLVGSLIQQSVTSKQPTVGTVPALTPALQGQGSAPVDPRAAAIAFVDHHAAGWIGAGIVSGLGFVALLWVLTFLYRATAARKPDLPAAARQLSRAAPAVLALTVAALQVSQVLSAHHFVHSADKSHEAADAATVTSPAAIAISTVRLVAGFAVGFVFVIVCLNAMRVGLLTRFMGVLGIIVGVLLAIPIFGSAVPVVQIFWLGALAVLLYGRWPNGMPPAWETGTAQPWPSQQESREARARAAGTRGGDRRAQAEPPPPEPEPAPERGPHHPSSKKRKRKRRR